MLENTRDSRADIVRILEICRDIELCCADIYKYYAEVFKSTVEIYKLWEKTSSEEENHANQFVLAVKLCRQGAIEYILLDQAKAENTLKKVKTLFEGIKLSKPSLSDALRSAIKLEEKLADFHTAQVTNFVDDSFKKMFIAMMEADNYHLARLQTTYVNVLKGVIYS